MNWPIFCFSIQRKPRYIKLIRLFAKLAEFLNFNMHWHNGKNLLFQFISLKNSTSILNTTNLQYYKCLMQSVPNWKKKDVKSYLPEKSASLIFRVILFIQQIRWYFSRCIIWFAAHIASFQYFSAPILNLKKKKIRFDCSTRFTIELSSGRSMLCHTHTYTQILWIYKKKKMSQSQTFSRYV